MSLPRTRGFQASEVWFNKFKVRCIVIFGKVAFADTSTAATYPEEFLNLNPDI